MLSPTQRELIAAAVDGHLSAEDKRAARQLLDSSAAARALYAKLKADRARVRALPQVAPPADLAARVMARVAAQPAQPASPVRAPAPRRVSVLRLVALAASLFIAVTASSFAFFNARGGTGDTARSNWANDLPVGYDAPAGPLPSPSEPFAPAPARPNPYDVARANVSPVPLAIEPKAVAGAALAPAPRPAMSDLLAGPLLNKMPSFDLVRVRMPFLRAVAELQREDIRHELIDELDNDPAFRFDLFVRDTGRGVDVFRNAARTAGLNLCADAATLERLKKRQSPSVVIYTESLTAKQLAALFGALAEEDTKFSPRVCESLHAVPVSRADENELKAVLGFDVGVFKRPTGTPGPKSPAKSVSSGTLSEVTKSLTNPPAPAENVAVLLTWQATNGGTRTPPALSAELKSYLSKRGERQPNAIPALIVIRETTR